MNNEEHVNYFLMSRRTQNNLSNRTLKAYRGDLRDFLLFIGSVPITQIDVVALRSYLVTLEGRCLNPSSIRRKLATLKLFFKHLKEEEYIEQSPTKRLIGKFRIPRLIPRVMSRLEVEHLLIGAYKSISSVESSNFLIEFRARRDHTILELLFTLGIRIDELVRLNVSDVDFDARTAIVFGKGRKERLLYISSEEVLNGLQEYIESRASLLPPSDALFLNRSRNRLSVHSIGIIFKKACEVASIKRKYTPHCLRHTMATMLIENGADVRSVQEILGHSSISTTELYLTVSRHRKREVMSKHNLRNHLQIRKDTSPANSG